jgi:hypothetical protein
MQLHETTSHEQYTVTILEDRKVDKEQPNNHYMSATVERGVTT